MLLDEMRNHYDDGFTSSERSTIENLYNVVCSKPIRRTGCSDCYRDAYIELITTLKRLGKMPSTPNYVLKAGAVLHEFGSSDFYTLNNIPDEFAEKWLASHPNDKDLFEKMPSDWEERVEKRKKNLGGEPKEANLDTTKEGASIEFVDEQPQEAEKPASRRGRPSSK